MPHVESSLLLAVKYHPDEQRLRLRFQPDAKAYDYFAVPQEVYDGLMAAESKGAYFNEHIRNRFLYAPAAFERR